MSAVKSERNPDDAEKSPIKSRVFRYSRQCGGVTKKESQGAIEDGYKTSSGAHDLGEILMKNIHTAHIVTGSREQIMIGSYDRQQVIEDARKLMEKYHRTVKFQTLMEDRK